MSYDLYVTYTSRMSNSGELLSCIARLSGVKFFATEAVTDGNPRSIPIG